MIEECTLLVDGKAVDVEDIQFETPRLVHKVTNAKAAIENRLGSPGFAINIQGKGNVPPWLDGKVHEVVIKHAGGKQLRPLHLPLGKVDEANGTWYGFGCIINCEQIPTWR